MSAALAAIEDLLPHRGNMLLLDRVLGFDTQHIEVEYTPRSEAWYADAQGDMPAWIGLELMAQAVAAHVALIQTRGNPLPRIGVLLGTRRYACTRPGFSAGVCLQIRGTLEFRDASGLGAYACTIHEGAQTLAGATLKVYEPDNVDEFIHTQEQDT